MIYQQHYELAHGLKTETRRLVKAGEQAIAPITLTNDMRVITSVLNPSGTTKRRVGGNYAIIPKMYKPQIGRYKLLGIRQENLHDLTPAGAIAEGIWMDSVGYYQTSVLDYRDLDPMAVYWALWESINGKASLKRNPRVWVYKFEVLSIDLGLIGEVAA